MSEPEHLKKSINLTRDKNPKANGEKECELSQVVDDNLKIEQSCHIESEKLNSKPHIGASFIHPSNAKVSCEALGRIKESPLNKSAPPSTDTLDISMLAQRWKGELDKWYKESPDTMKNSVFNCGKLIGQDIKKAREQGKNYLILTSDSYEFKINVGGLGTSVGNTELTKTRFFAIVHRYLHDAALKESDPESKGFRSSALVGRVEFEQDNPLYKYRFLLGEGFPLNYDIFKAEEEQIIFLLGCLLLDFLSSHSNRSPRYESCKNIKTFLEYIETSAAKCGDMLLAGLRQSNDSLSSIDNNLPLLKEMAGMLTIHPFGTSYYTILVQKKFAAIHKELGINNN